MLVLLRRLKPLPASDPFYDAPEILVKMAAKSARGDPVPLGPVAIAAQTVTEAADHRLRLAILAVQLSDDTTRLTLEAWFAETEAWWHARASAERQRDRVVLAPLQAVTTGASATVTIFAFAERLDLVAGLLTAVALAGTAVLLTGARLRSARVAEDLDAKATAIARLLDAVRARV